MGYLLLLQLNVTPLLIDACCAGSMAIDLFIFGTYQSPKACKLKHARVMTNLFLISSRGRTPELNAGNYVKRMEEN